MAERKPLVLVDGQPQELPSGDTVDADMGDAELLPFITTDGSVYFISMVIGE